MKTAHLLVLLSAMFSARSETVLQADRVADVLVLNQVYLNERGPYRMMVDTGNGSSILRPIVAARLNLRPAYAVEAETAAGVKRVAVAVLEAVGVGSVQDRGIEAMIMEVKFPGVDGVLGQSWLVRHDYLLDYQNRRLVVDIAAPPTGIQASLLSAAGRPQFLPRWMATIRIWSWTPGHQPLSCSDAGIQMVG
jgi:gag-polyprotein putative aspartyl protease